MSMASNLGLSSKSSKSTVTNVAEQAPMSENIEVATYKEMMVSVKRLRKTRNYFNQTRSHGTENCKLLNFIMEKV